MNTSKPINNKALSDKYMYYQKTKIYKKKKPTKTKIKVKNTSIVIFYLTSLALYIISFFTLRLITIKDKENLLSPNSKNQVFDLDNINNILNVSLNNVNDTNGIDYFKFKGCLTQEIKFGFNYIIIDLKYNIIDAVNDDIGGNTVNNTINNTINNTGDNDNELSYSDACLIKNNNTKISGKSNIKIKIKNLINTKKDINTDYVVNQIMDNIYEKMVIQIIDYINYKIFNDNFTINSSNYNNSCLNFRKKKLEIETNSYEKNQNPYIDLENFNNPEIKKLIIEPFQELLNKFLKPSDDIDNPCYQEPNDDIQQIEREGEGEGEQNYNKIKTNVTNMIKSKKEIISLITEYLKLIRIGIISILIIVVLLKLIQIKTKSRIISMFYHIFSYASMLIFLVLSITLFIPKTVLSLYDETKKIIKNYKFVNNLENLLMFLGSMILLTIKIMELIL